MKLQPIQLKMWNLREYKKFYAATGQYKEFVAASKEYAKEFVANPQAALSMPPTPRVTFPLFTKEGFNLVKVMIRELFRKKTPEEKELYRIVEEMKVKKQLNIDA